MHIDRVILASDENPTYLEFWPLVARAWRRIGILPTLALVGRHDLAIDESVGEVHHFAPVERVDTGLQAQVIRLLLPALFRTEVSLLSDIDMLPLSARHFRDAVADVDDGALAVFRDRAYPADSQRYPICYVAARGSTFAEVFGIATRDDVHGVIAAWAALEWGWNTDERVLYDYATRWHARTGRLVLLGHQVTRRIDRSRWRYLPPLVPLGHYVDAHLPRPYSTHRRTIDALAWWAALRRVTVV
jgi:hypothetical protein